jgi:hypothetical protein
LYENICPTAGCILSDEARNEYIWKKLRTFYLTGKIGYFKKNGIFFLRLKDNRIPT